MGYIPPPLPVNPKLEKIRHCPMCGENCLLPIYSFWFGDQYRCQHCGFKAKRSKFYRRNPFGILAVEKEICIPE